MDVNDANETVKEAVRNRNRGKRYMDPEMNMRFSQQRQGNPFDFPETPDELELMVGWFFDRLRVMVTIENHLLKFDGVRQIIDILQIACKYDIKRVSFNNYVLIEVDDPVDLTFSWYNGQWYIDNAGGPDDIINLPKVLKRFGRIYRFNAKEYAYGDDDDINMLQLEE